MSYYSGEMKTVDFRAHPELYRIARGEQGVLSVEPYKSEILPHWRFRNPEEAESSAAEIRALFCGYRDAGDFVGMDMARKFIQMGFTRARRYANHRSGRKYKKGTKEVLPLDPDPVKARAAEIFKAVLEEIKIDPVYVALAERHQATYERRGA